MDALKHLHSGEFLSYSLTSQDSQFLGCQTISTDLQIQTIPCSISSFFVLIFKLIFNIKKQ